METTAERSEIARQFAALRPTRDLICPACGKQFRGMGRRRYCSGACRVRACYRRHNPLAVKLD